MIRLTLEQAHQLAQDILRSNGFSEPHVQAVSATVLAGSAMAVPPMGCIGCWAAYAR